MAGEGLRVGDRFGPYRLDRLIGRGGMGEVYQAYDEVKDRTVALKILIARYALDPVYRQRFQREAHSAARLQEAHVIPIHDYGEIHGHLFLDMRLVEGRSLRDLLVAEGPLPPARAVAIVSQTASALDAAHRDGLVHRDVKPDNILVAPDDFAYLVDFGIANSATDARLTEIGGAVGSFAYMSPERFESGPVTPAGDVYALACVLFECVMGKRPFRGTTDAELVRAHLFEQPPSVASAAPSALDAVIARGLAKNPAERFPTAGALAAAARDALTTTQLSSQPTHTNTPPTRATTPPMQLGSPPTGFGAPPTPKPRKRGLLLAAIAVVAALAIGGGTWALLGRSTPESTDGTPTLSGLDVGQYQTQPRRFNGTPTFEEGRSLESYRLAEGLVNPYDIDPALDHIYGFAQPDPALAATSIAGTGLPITQPAMEQFGMISAAEVQGYTKRLVDYIHDPAGNSLIVLLMSYPNPDAAAQAATAIEAADFAANPENIRTTIADYPDAHAHYRPGSPTISATWAHRNLVVAILAGIYAPFDLDALTQRIHDVLDAQKPLMDTLITSPEAALTTLPRDPDHMLSRTFTTDDSLVSSADFGSRGPRAVLTCASSQAVKDELYQQAGVDRCSSSPDSQVLRAKDPDAARDLLPALLDAETEEYVGAEIDAPAGIADARCYEQKDTIWADGFSRRYVCGIASGRYVAYVWSDDELDVRQRAAAQYAILQNS